MNVYVAAPYADAPVVRALHAALAAQRLKPTSTWADKAVGTDLAARADVDLDEARATLAQNDADLASADAVLVLARPGVGGEMFAEIRWAIGAGIPVIWVGRRILSAFRPGVTLCNDLDEALDELFVLRDRHAAIDEASSIASLADLLDAARKAGVL